MRRAILAEINLCSWGRGSGVATRQLTGMPDLPLEEHDLGLMEGEDEDVITASSDELAATVVTYEDLVAALKRILGKKGMSDTDVEKLAIYLLNFFGYSDYIIDNILNTEDRDVFYMLEEEGLLTTEREEIYILKGKVWRIHYWMLRKRRILELARGEEKVKAAVPEDAYSVYDQMPEDQWTHARVERAKKEREEKEDEERERAERKERAEREK